MAMVKWLLSGHNPQETFGIPYPITVNYSVEFAAHRQFEHVMRSLVGNTDELDPALRPLMAVQGRLYININCFAHAVGPVLPFDPTSFGAPRGLVTTDRKPRLTTRVLLPFRLGRMYLKTAQIYREAIPRYRKTLDEIYWQLRTYDPERLTEQNLALLNRLFAASLTEDAATFLNAYNIVAFMNTAISQAVGQRAPGLLNLLVGRGTSTAQLATRMWDLGQVAEQCGPKVREMLGRGITDLQAYGDTPEAAPLLQAVEGFMRTYGHRAFRYASEFEATRLADQPELVLLTVAGLLEGDEPPAVRAEAARQAGERALRAMNPAKRLFWKYLLKWGSVWVERREENRDTLELQNATYGLGARLLSGHYFPDQPPDHLWLYTFDEFLAFGQSHGQERVGLEEVERRRAELERHRRQPSPPELIWYDPETQEWWPVQEQEAREEGMGEPVPGSKVRLEGIGASAGSGPVEGHAVVTNSVEEAVERILDLSGPVVLVTHVTDPVWSSLFSRLTAVVTEMGGAISHAAVVARENGIPAVVGVQEATRWIRDGQQVRVDGTMGTVETVE